MTYHTSGGIFAGLDDTDPVLNGYGVKRHARRRQRSLRGLDDTDPVLRGLRGLDDSRGVYSLRQPLRGLGEIPPGTKQKDKAEARRSFYYLYSIATMEPVFRKQAGISAGVGVAGVVGAFATGGLSLILTGGAAAAGAIMAAGTENMVMETTLWWKRSKKDRDNFIKGAFVGEDVKDKLRKAARRMDSATKGIKDPLRRQRARARAYFQDFIAVGQRAALKSLTPDQQGAFGYAYLQALAAGKKEQTAIDEGNKAAIRVKQESDNAAKKLKLQQAKEQAQARRREAVEKAKAAGRAEMQKKAKLEAAKAKIRAAKDAAAAAAAQKEVAAAEAEAAKAVADKQKAEAEANAAAAEEKQTTDAVKVVEKQEEALQPTPAEKQEAAAADSDEEKVEDKAPEAADKATGTATTTAASTAKGGGGGILPIVAAAGALALGAPALPVVGVAAALAFAMRKK